MKIRTQGNQLIDMTEKETTTVLTPTGSYQILAHTKDKKKGTILGEYSTEPKAVRVPVSYTHLDRKRGERMKLQTISLVISIIALVLAIAKAAG